MIRATGILSLHKLM